jgi:transcriptional regulator with GAF, ATPase, and Fis domain
MENISKLKSYRSFRIPVKPTDKVYLNLVKCDGIGLSDDHVKWVLQNVSLTGVAFQTSAKFDEDSVLEIELKYKRFHFAASAKIIRITPVYNDFGETESYQYGVEFFLQDQDNGREFISHFISGFSTRRLKKHLINLLINESRINTFTDGQKLSLCLSLFTDMKQFKDMDSFLKMVFNECCRLSNSEVGNIYILNSGKNELHRLDLQDNSRYKFCSLKNQTMINELFSKKRYKILKGGNHLSLSTFPSVYINEKEEEFKQALYFPMLDSQGRVYGVFEFITFSASRGYTDKDLGVIEIFSSIFTMCYEQLDKGDYVKHLLDKLETNDNVKLIGKSSGITSVNEFISKSKDSEKNILIEGEHGVGKIHMAKKIHEHGQDSNMSFGQIDCDQINSAEDLKLLLLGDDENVGRLELYSGGTILIHEPSLLDYESQKLLCKELLNRADIRIITTSTTSLSSLVTEKKFSVELLEVIADSYYKVDPLKYRKEDIPHLVNYFLDMYCSMYGLPPKRVCPSVMTIFREYDWPGNVAELQQTIERFVNYYPYIRFLDELPQKEFPIIGLFARQYGIFVKAKELVTSVDEKVVLEKLVQRYCSLNDITIDEFYTKFPENFQLDSSIDKAS